MVANRKGLGSVTHWRVEERKSGLSAMKVAAEKSCEASMRVMQLLDAVHRM